MKARSAAVTGALAVAGLVAAYATWQRPPEETTGEALVLDVSKSAIQKIRYEDARRAVEVNPDGERVWIRSVEKPPPPPPPKPTALAGSDGGTQLASAQDGGGAVATSASAASAGGTSPQVAAADAGVTEPVAALKPASEPKTREFRGNDAALNLIERFAPLHAVRALGKLSPEKLEEVGLAESQRVMEVVTSRGTHRFKISSEALGSTSPYVLEEDSGRVFILRGTLLSDLEYASSRLVDRRLHTFQDHDFDAVVVEADGKQRRLVKVADKLAESEQASPDEFATNWHERIWRLLGVDVLGRGEVPAAGEPQIQLRVEYRKTGKPVGFIELGKAGEEVFARTEHTAGWVRLHAGTAQILNERAKVVEPQS